MTKNQEANNVIVNMIKTHIADKTTIDDIDLNKVFKKLTGGEARGDLKGVIKTLNNQLKRELKKITQANPNISPIDAFNLLESKDRSFIDYIYYIFQQLFSCISVLRALSNTKFPKIPQEVIDTLQSQVKEKIKEIIRNVDSRGVISGLSSRSTDREGAGVHDVRQYAEEEAGHTFFVKDVTTNRIYKILTSIENEGIREVFGSTFYYAMGVTNAAKAGVVVNSSNEAVKIFSKKVGEVGDKVISLGQLKRLIEQEQSGDLTEDQQAFKKIIGDHKDIRSFLDANPTLKQAIIDAHAVSALAGNRDLHNDNIMIVIKPNDELQCAPIDFGLCGHNVSQLRLLNKLGFIKFSGEEMRHRDSLDLFTRQEYIASLTQVVDKFKTQRDKIETKFAVTFAALQDKGIAGDYRFERFLGNVEKNVRQAERFCGMSSVREIVF